MTLVGLFSKDGGMDRLLFDIAEYDKPRDRKRLYKQLRGKELFATVLGSKYP